jgi:hypothetical protein
MYLKIRCLLVALILFFSLSVALHAQAVSGTIVGTVIDPSGATVANALLEWTGSS